MNTFRNYAGRRYNTTMSYLDYLFRLSISTRHSIERNELRKKMVLHLRHVVNDLPSFLL